jgi:hypothetical protein
MAAKEKITISWDDLNARRVEDKLREQQAVERNHQYARLAESPHLAAAVARPQKGSIWYNTMLYMAVFGLLGGFLAWGSGRIFDFKPSARIEAAELIAQVNEIDRAVRIGRLAPSEAAVAFAELDRVGSDNPFYRRVSATSGEIAAPRPAAAQLSAHDAMKEAIRNILCFGVAGLMLAMCLAAAEPLVSRNFPAAITNGAIGAVAGLLGGIVVAMFVDPLYQMLGGSDGALTTTHQIAARAITWGVLGLSLSLAPAATMRSWKKLGIGALGGLLGGIVGGMAFDPIVLWTGDPELGRLVGLLAIGLVAGAGAGLIENAAKTGWVRVVAGLIAGKQFILYRNPTYIGSSPDNQIYLFKDQQVGRRHAAIHVDGNLFEIENLPLGGPTRVNGRPVARARLRHGDQVQIGATTFLFQEKQRTLQPQ